MYDQSCVVVSKFKQNKKEQPQFILLSQLKCIKWQDTDHY